MKLLLDAANRHYPKGRPAQHDDPKPEDPSAFLVAELNSVFDPGANEVHNVAAALQTVERLQREVDAVWHALKSHEARFGGVDGELMLSGPPLRLQWLDEGSDRYLLADGRLALFFYADQLTESTDETVEAAVKACRRAFTWLEPVDLGVRLQRLRERIDDALSEQDLLKRLLARGRVKGVPYADGGRGRKQTSIVTYPNPQPTGDSTVKILLPTYSSYPESDFFGVVVTVEPQFTEQLNQRLRQHRLHLQNDPGLVETVYRCALSAVQAGGQDVLEDNGLHFLNDADEACLTLKTADSGEVMVAGEVLEFRFTGALGGKHAPDEVVTSYPLTLKDIEL